MYILHFKYWESFTANTIGTFFGDYQISIAKYLRWYLPSYTISKYPSKYFWVGALSLSFRSELNDYSTKSTLLQYIDTFLWKLFSKKENNVIMPFLRNFKWKNMWPNNHRKDRHMDNSSIYCHSSDWLLQLYIISNKLNKCYPKWHIDMAFGQFMLRG